MRIGKANGVSSYSFPGTQIVVLKEDDWLEKQKIAGKAVADCLLFSKNIIEAETPNITLKDIEAECLKIIEAAGCTPTFHNYKGFPGIVCASVNKQLVHGIPTDYKLQQGDVVKIDLGATYEGVIADAAISAIYGKAKDWQHEKMLEVCKGALAKAISVIEICKRLGCIGHAIHQFTKKSGFKLITHYGGHGIDLDTPHASPFVANRARPDEGIRIQPGLSIAIEPMLSMESDKTKKAKDNWTVLTRGISCHWEHSIFVGTDKIHVLTDWEGKYN